MITDQSILRHLERQPHRSAGFKQLVREMGLRGAERQQLADLLQALVKSGRLIETGRDRYTLAEHAATRQNLIAGRLTMHRDGYGFVIPNVGQRNTLSGDIFIPPAAIGSAMHGDQVLAELARKKEDGRAEGRILRVLSRGNPSVVGTFHYGSRHNYVTPMDEKITQEVIIPRGMEWPSGEQKLLENSNGQNPSPGAPRFDKLGTGSFSPGERVQRQIASSAPKPAAASGRISKAWWLRSRSPNGLRQRKIPAGVWSKSSAMRTTSV